MGNVYRVAITRLSDGETRTVSEPIRPGDTREFVSFYWSEGNMGCDCNRYIQFQLAGGEEVSEEMDGIKCGEDLYSAKIIDFGSLPESG